MLVDCFYPDLSSSLPLIKTHRQAIFPKLFFPASNSNLPTISLLVILSCHTGTSAPSHLPAVVLCDVSFCSIFSYPLHPLCNCLSFCLYTYLLRGERIATLSHLFEKVNSYQDWSCFSLRNYNDSIVDKISLIAQAFHCCLFPENKLSKGSYI